jgi:transaldolase
MSQSVVERLLQTNPSMEVWWDSSPLVFDPWVKKMVASAPPEKKAELEAQLKRLFVTSDPVRSVFRGCTTNPPLSLTAVKSDPAYWNRRIDELIAANSGITPRELFWETYKAVIRRGAEMMLPIWQASEGRYGFVSGQLDPRLISDKDAMRKQAVEIAALAPNVMVKVPASCEGVEVVRDVTSKGISTNVTTCFTLPQIMAVARAAREGLDAAKKSGVDTSRWRAVITHMLGRLTERPELMKQAEYHGIALTEADRKWLGLAVVKRACQLLDDGGYPSKMLVCSVRPGPHVTGKMRFWDIECLAGGDVVFTIPPGALEPMFALGDDLIFDPGAIHRPAPQASIDKLMKLPYGIQSLEPHGMSPDQFNTHPATLYTAAEFSKASAGLEEYVAGRLALASAGAAIA